MNWQETIKLIIRLSESYVITRGKGEETGENELGVLM